MDTAGNAQAHYFDISSAYAKQMLKGHVYCIDMKKEWEMAGYICLLLLLAMTAIAVVAMSNDSSISG